MMERQSESWCSISDEEDDLDQGSDEEECIEGLIGEDDELSECEYEE